MKWPWEKRAEQAEKEAACAEQDYARAEEHWETARELADAAKAQRELNGWTGKVLDIFSG